jgi:MFS family permease
VASVDAFARARRRRLAIAPWAAWLGAGVLAFVIGVVLAYLLGLVGAIDPPAAPVPPELEPLGVGPLVALVAVLGVVAGGWVLLRRLAIAADPDLRDPSAPGAAVVLSLALAVATLVLWLVNPFSALVMVPALHGWMLAVLVDPAPGRRARLAMIAGGLVLPALLCIYQLIVLHLDPLSGAWYLLLLVTGGHVGLLGALLGCVFAACLAGLVAAVLSTPGEPPPPPREVPTVRGPASYAGPGSLGGTDSALRR